MISVNSILSRNQGKLLPAGMTEDDYYTLFSGKPQAPAPAVSPRRWYFLEFNLQGMWTNPGK